MRFNRWNSAIWMGLSILCLAIVSVSVRLVYVLNHSPLLEHIAHNAVLVADFGELKHHSADDDRVRQSGFRPQAIFLGDSITARWRLTDFFPGKPYLNRGIDSQTTQQMLLRFRQDVIELHPTIVVIEAGINDIAVDTGPETLKRIEADYASMAELSRLHGIRVVFASVLPVHHFMQPMARRFSQQDLNAIRATNDWIQHYCAANHFVYIDYFNALADDKKLLRTDLAIDGVHPNAAGYRIMAPLAEAAIQASSTR